MPKRGLEPNHKSLPPEALLLLTKKAALWAAFFGAEERT